MSELTLPKDFFFGAAMSGPQTEGGWNVGGKLENLWDTWSIEDIGSFYNQVGSYVGNDFMHHYKEDLALLKSLGMDNYRTSIQWSRLLDADGNVNPEGAAWYHELFAASKEAGLEVFVNLYHFDMPTYLFRRGGWENREVCEAYACSSASPMASPAPAGSPRASRRRPGRPRQSSPRCSPPASTGARPCGRCSRSSSAWPSTCRSCGSPSALRPSRPSLPRRRSRARERLTGKMATARESLVREGPGEK